MAKTNTFKIIDRGWNKLKKQSLTLSKGKATAVGFQGSEAEIVDPEHGGLTNVELAAIHEFGTKDGRIPERPMIRQTFDENQSKYEKEMANVARAFYDGKNIDGELLVVGEGVKADVFKKVRGAQFEPWAPLTMAMKALIGKEGDVPLWDTGQLMNSLTAIVTDNPNEKRQS
jgi:phage gpG-like protein